jgi:hypothetical protein
MGDAVGFVDRDTNQLIAAAAFALDLDHFYSVRRRYPLRDFLDFGDHFLPHVLQKGAGQQKSGLSPTRMVRHLLLLF